MGGCAVADCKSNDRNNKNCCFDDKVSFFTFPKDEKRAKEWLVKCKRSDKTKYNNNDKVCSLHFDAKYFDKTSLPEQYNLPAKRRKLFDNAVPTLNLPTSLSTENKRTTLTSKW